MIISLHKIDPISRSKRVSTDVRSIVESAEDISINDSEYEFDRTHSILKRGPLHGVKVCGIFKRSYAYRHLRYSIPNTLNIVIDDLLADTERLVEIYGPKVQHEIEILTYCIQYLISCVKRNRTMELFTKETEDKDVWNDFILAQNKKYNHLFQISALCVDAYINRKLACLFKFMPILHDYDYFHNRKKLIMDLTENLFVAVATAYENIENKRDIFIKLLKTCLWSNYYDPKFCIWGKTDDDLTRLLNYPSSYLLIDQCQDVWNAIQLHKGLRIDVLCGNMGIELFADFVLADFLLTYKYTPKLRYYVRPTPWCGTNVTAADIQIFLKRMTDNKNILLRNLGKKFNEYFDKGEIELVATEFFWISPHDYFEMKEIKPELYDSLSEAGMLITKGDFNYRKLLGDFMWESTEEFITCLRGFYPTNICAMRVIKSDCICGLKVGQAAALRRSVIDWKYDRNYGTIQYLESIECKCQQIARQKAIEDAKKPKLSYCQKMKLMKDNNLRN